MRPRANAGCLTLALRGDGVAAVEESGALGSYDADGQRTSQYICTQCGRTLTFKERAEWMLVNGKGD